VPAGLSKYTEWVMNYLAGISTFAYPTELAVIYTQFLIKYLLMVKRPGLETGHWPPDLFIVWRFIKISEKCRDVAIHEYLGTKCVFIEFVSKCALKYVKAIMVISLHTTNL